MIELKTASEIQRMAHTGRFVATVLNELSALAEPGINLLDLELRAREMVDDAGATSCYWDYAPSFGSGPFRNVICLSLNDAVLHGLPHDAVLADGDVLSMDFAVSIDGWVADAAVTTIIGAADPEDQRLVDTGYRALAAGIAAAVPGARMGDIGFAIGEVVGAGGYGLNSSFGGHGLGRTMHEDPHVPNMGRRRRGLRLVPGLVLALEPWFARGTDRIVVDGDGWTVRSADGSRAVHCEHTVAITEDGPQVLTSLG